METRLLSQRLIRVCSVFLLLVLLLPTHTFVHASPVQAKQVLITQLQQQAGSDFVLDFHQETGVIRFLATSAQHPFQQDSALLKNATPATAARTFLTSYAPLFGLDNPDTDLKVMREESLDARHFVRFQQTYRGVPVVGGELISQLDLQYNVISVNGETIPDLALDVNPAIDASTAQQTAYAKLARDYQLNQSTFNSSSPELWIYNPVLLGGPGVAINRLVWRMEITNTDPNGEPIREFMLVDAQRNTVALNFNQIANAKYRIVCDRNNVRDTDQDPGNNCDSPTEYTRVEGGTASSITDVNNAYAYSGATYDYFWINHQRDSIDGLGMNLISVTRYCLPILTFTNCPFANAFWNGQVMTYGAGFASADDVVAHELTHGVTERTANLFYYYQSGAINESMSDVFGEFIDQTDFLGNDSTTVRWQMGEDLPASIGVIRNMQDPTIYSDPDRMLSPNYYAGGADYTTTDNGGVHINSGVNNKAAYLLAQTATPSVTFNGRTVTGLGIPKTSKIYYRALTNMLVSGSDYRDLYYVLQASCQSQIGLGGITSADCQEVLDAVTATEMNLSSVPKIPAEAPFCTNGFDPAFSFSDNMENTASGNWTRGTGWVYTTGYATSGINSLYIEDPASSSNTSVTKATNVAIPANAFLRFNQAYEFESNSAETTFYDGGILEYSINSGTSWSQVPAAWFTHNGYGGTLSNGSALAGLQAFRGRSRGYISTRVDLATLGGQNNVRFRFRFASDSSTGDLGWLIDDFRIYVCNAPTAITNIQAVQGDNQRTPVNQAFNELLTVRIQDELGQGIEGLQVTFTAPTNGASGTFSNGTNTAIATTNLQGFATAPTFIANDQVGTYTVQAVIQGYEDRPITFTLTNQGTNLVYIPLINR